MRGRISKESAGRRWHRAQGLFEDAIRTVREMRDKRLS
jgi:hypothetical protein